MRLGVLFCLPQLSLGLGQLVVCVDSQCHSFPVASQFVQDMVDGSEDGDGNDDDEDVDGVDDAAIVSLGEWV